MSSMGRERSSPRVFGTMQKAQSMLQPCWMETKAVTVFFQHVLADRVLRTRLLAYIDNRLADGRPRRRAARRLSKYPGTW